MSLFHPDWTQVDVDVAHVDMNAVQVDVDAALVEAERVGQVCSRQFPSCSVSRIDILRFGFLQMQDFEIQCSLNECFCRVYKDQKDTFCNMPMPYGL